MLSIGRMPQVDVRSNVGYLEKCACCQEASSRLFSLLSQGKQDRKRMNVEQDIPIDLSYKRRRVDTESDGSSILESLLSGEKRSPSRDSTISTSSFSSSSSSPDTETSKKVRLSNNAAAVLSPRISELLVQAANFAKSSTHFESLSRSDQIALIQDAWCRLLIISMAEERLHFDVIAVSSCEANDQMPSNTTVETIMAFIQKCQSLKVDDSEYTLMKSIALFKSSAQLQDREAVEGVEKTAIGLLQRQPLRFTKIITTLRRLYSVDPEQIANLFCSHIVTRLSMDRLWPELLNVPLC